MDMVNAVLTAVTKIFLQNVNIFGQCRFKLELKMFFKNKICLPQKVPMGAMNAFLANPPEIFRKKTKKIRSITKLVEKQNLKTEKVLEVFN